MTNAIKQKVVFNNGILQFNFDAGIKIELDLNSYDLEKDQYEIISKSAKALENEDDEVFFNPEACIKEKCPSQPHLSESEFQRIQGLKATIKSSSGNEALRAPVADFCFKVINQP